jgi:hypothetical protein
VAIKNIFGNLSQSRGQENIFQHLFSVPRGLVVKKASINSNTSTKPQKHLSLPLFTATGTKINMKSWEV